MAGKNKLDRLFKALSDQDRRYIIEVVEDEPGIRITDLCEYFPTSRFAVMKHVNILEDIGVLFSKREGKNKRLYLDREPLKYMVDGWFSKFI
jgi:DNA-binding transcriptional ArsR family regulator